MSEVCSLCGKRAQYKVTRGSSADAYCAACLSRRSEGELLPLLEAMMRPKVVRGRCPHCGWTDAQLEQTGLVGCPLCYDALDHVILAGFAPVYG